MLDIGWTELLVIAVIMIVVVGPKDLPPMLRAFGKMTSNLRKMAGDFRTQFDQALREADMDDVRQTLSDAQRLNPANALREAMNPLREMGNEIRSDLQKATSVPPLSEIGKKPDEAAGEGVLDELGPAPGMSLPETPPISVAPVPSDAAVSAPAAPASAAQIASAGPAATSSTPGSASGSVAVVPDATKKPRASRSKPVAVATEVAAPETVAKRTRTAKAIAAAAASPEPIAKPAGKRLAKPIEADAVAAEAIKPVRQRKKPSTPKDDA
jgi:sec-independent protein translocase protein TatB